MKRKDRFVIGHPGHGQVLYGEEAGPGIEPMTRKQAERLASRMPRGIRVYELTLIKKARTK